LRAANGRRIRRRKGRRRVKSPRSKRRNALKCVGVKNKDTTILRQTFSKCWSPKYACSLHAANSSKIHSLGGCLIDKYPATQTLDLRKTLSSGHGSVHIQSDSECSQFISQFFPLCAKYIPSCVKVGKDVMSETGAVGCLFSQYPTLMIPLLSADDDLNKV